MKESKDRFLLNYKRLKSFSQQIALILWALSVSCFGHEPSEQYEPEQHEAPIIILRGEGNYPPHEYYEKEKLKGYHIELIQHAAKKLNLPIEFKSLPWKRAVAMIELGQADAITFMTKTKDREEFAIFQDDNILSTSISGLIGAENSSSITAYDGTLNSIKHLTIGVQLGFNYGSKFDKAEYINKVEFLDIDMLTSTLRAGRIDLALLTLQEYNLFKTRGKMDGIMFLSPAINQFGNYLAFSRARNNAHLSLRFAQALKAIKDSPINQQLLTNYPLMN
ncbi:substrate-binding periplasmic protein [Litoribrevibacter albus]|uniref:ABC transporter substrate-binding protein n=1 Tax=Litoribrevibacter albus TaxID=1473156 RepID=A0AA37W6P1_9GAMM|nr:transporter substrate-binding domain-containing protein [Litoribrevibacter albus]GLQ31735.1 ABC transporter substrate-binding protein [Litoribrevibacter albus]